MKLERSLYLCECEGSHGVYFYDDEMDQLQLTAASHTFDDKDIERLTVAIIPLDDAIRATDLKAENERLRVLRRLIVPGALSCGYECHYAEPYGFVPEEGCPEHDKDEYQ